MNWKTTAVTALPPGLSATLQMDGDDEQSTYPVVAMLLQTGAYEDIGVEVTRVQLGVLNPFNGEIEPVSGPGDDTAGLGYLVSINNLTVLS